MEVSVPRFLMRQFGQTLVVAHLKRNRRGMGAISRGMALYPRTWYEDDSSGADAEEAFFVIAFDFGPKFPLGHLVITANAARELPPADIRQALHRHVRGDWGDLDAHDLSENEVSLKGGFRILSAYRASNGTKFWIITESDRKTTTILLPEDY